MVFTHDTELALRAAVALVNSASAPDTLTSVAELDAYVKRFRYTGRHDRTRAELDAVRALRPQLRELLTADRDRAAELVNALLRERGAIPQLVRHPSQDWHIHATSPEDPLPARVAVESAMALIDVIRANEMSRLAECADADCDGIVLDLSRNRSRRYCSTLCSNRNAVAAYRARSAQGHAAPRSRGPR